MRFIGREVELARAAAWLQVTGGEPAGSRILNLWGAAGSGKTAFLQELRHRTETGGSRPWVQVRGLSAYQPVFDFVRHSASALPAALPAPGPAWERQLLATGSPTEQAATGGGARMTYTQSGIKPLDAGENFGLIDARRARSLATLWLSLFGPSGGPLRPTIFVIDPLPALSWLVREWFRDWVMPEMLRLDPREEFRLLVVSPNPWLITGSAELWGPLADGGQDLQIGPLREEDTILLAAESRIDQETARFIHRHHRGLACAVVAELAQRASKTPASSRTEDPSFEPAWRRLSAAQRSWLTSAVLLPDWSEEGCGVLLGPGQSEPALRWLRSQRLLPFDRPGRCSDERLRQRWLDWLRHHHPDPFPALQERWEVLRRIHLQVPKADERAQLRRFGGLIRIDAPLLRRLYGAETGALLSFIRRHPTLFETLSCGHKVVDTLRIDLARLCGWLEPPTHEERCRIAAEVWAERMVELKLRRAKLENHLLDLGQRETRPAAARALPPVAAREPATPSGSKLPAPASIVRAGLDLGGIALIYGGIILDRSLVNPLVFAGFGLISISLLPDRVLFPFARQRRPGTIAVATSPAPAPFHPAGRVPLLERQLRAFRLQLRELEQESALPYV
ncbi:MAG: hypothetical protein EA425_04110 [Puniceicoccaceae bacterium]|nr:MAG: hypothetical protein EA425_04110 [Puniceicoccaceae bacterium]